MKLFKNIPILMLAVFFLFSACRTEDEEIITPPEQEILAINSTTADLITRTTTNDGSNDNILDNASCLSIQLPVTVIIDGLEIIIDSEADLDVIEAIFDEFDDDIDELDFVFPITIILSDFTEITITNAQELQAFIDECSGENEPDDDIECIDFQYPITYAVFDQNNELIETVTINNDQEHYEFIDNLEDSDIVSINFPLTLILANGNTVTVNNILQLEDVIENAIDDCDEDDDNDYDDDDCEDCTTDQLTSILTECPSWVIDKLERDDNDLEDSYTNIEFSFSTDGTITIDDNGTITTGTWNAVTNDMTNIIQVAIDVPGDTNVSDIWMLHEIEEEIGEVNVDLRIGDDRLRFESTCNEDDNDDDDDDDGNDCEDCTTDQLTSILTECPSWGIDKLERNDNDLEDNYTNIEFSFSTDGTITIDDNGMITNGTWDTVENDMTNLIEVVIDVPNDADISDTWILHEIEEVTGEVTVDLRIGNDRLRFESTCEDGGNDGGDNTFLEDVLTAENSIWIVSSYVEDNNDETADFNGFEFVFNIDGTATATNAGNVTNGTWAHINNETELLLNFGTSMPLDELEDDWEIISVTETQVELQDISGGNGGTDILIFERN
ncbi:hypothetical protein [uncultured Dokdonia sp.]|uniref:hypothetical protein n=1 Tax=uncultured Dokdonia sp. TaxID=575653 RepID=UPI00260E0E5F|nr:hypothetical protein [uncultured Dokdonia sp.]